MKGGRVLCIATVALLGSIGASGRARVAAPQAPASINVVVEQSDGVAVVGLVRDDFEVAIDGRVQRIEAFSTDDSPVTFILMIDLTWSVSASLKPEVLREAIRADVLPNLVPGDRLRLGRVEMDPPLAPGFLSSPAEILKAARTSFATDDDRSAGASPLWDATIAAVSALEAEPGRRAVVLMSDGQATGNRWSMADANQKALLAGVTVHAIAQGGDQLLMQGPRVAARVRPGLGLQQIADLTGGIFTRDVGFVREPGKHLARVIRNVHRSYTIGFVPDVTQQGPYKLQVVVKRPGVNVRAPKGLVIATAASR